MKLLMLATRNLFRNPLRTAITLAAVCFGMVLIHFTVVLQTGQYRQMISKGVSTLAGHVVVQAEGYQEERDPDLYVDNASEVVKVLTEAYPDEVVAPASSSAGCSTAPPIRWGFRSQGSIRWGRPRSRSSMTS